MMKMAGKKFIHMSLQVHKHDTEQVPEVPQGTDGQECKYCLCTHVSQIKQINRCGGETDNCPPHYRNAGLSGKKNTEDFGP